MMARLLIVLSALLLSACADFRQTLTDDKGNTVQCSESATGLVFMAIAKSRFDDCVHDYEERGFRRAP